MPKHMAALYPEISVVDVYDTAAAIGQEFEKIIDNFGPEAVTELMPKVIQVLEQLEILAGRNQKENADITELKFTVERLQAEKTAKAAEREQFEKELESIEESWQAETKRLVDSVARLQEENKKLKSSLQDTQGRMENLQKEHDIEMVTELKSELDRQRHTSRTLEREIKQKNVDIEAMKSTETQMQQQLERLAKLNVDYRRKTALTQKRSQSLIQDKADLQAQLHDKEQQINRIKESMLDAESPGSPPVAPEDKSFVGKMVIDMSDPDRPRFTLNELRQVLTERNELKTKLIEVEEELHTFKPQDAEYETLDSELNSKENAEEGDEVLPVQGPINREPYEKLYPGQKESGIRKIFSFLWSPSSKSVRKKAATLPKQPLSSSTSPI